MTIVIQEVKTRRFYAGSGDWTGDPKEALAFTDTRHALKYCRTHRLSDVRLVVFLRDRKVSLLLYVPGSKSPSPAGEIHTAEA